MSRLLFLFGVLVLLLFPLTAAAGILDWFDSPTVPRAAKQIAEQIFISEKTVARHLANLYAKLGVSSRTAAVAWAHENNVLN